MRNNKKTAILVKEVNTKKRLFLVYRPNTSRQVKLETYADIKKKFKKVTSPSLIQTHLKRKSENVKINNFFCFFKKKILFSGFVRRRQTALD